ncbi:MAG: guanylate kinase [Clostridia bacterium]|nr:guanylate kinase [Clostridia bacterium]
MRNVLFVLSGPSGVGKGTLAKLLVKRNPNIQLSISCTTRKPRKNEIDGKDYFFISKESFNEKISQDGFLEYSNHFDNFYGTPKDFVFSKLNDNDVLLEIDVNGGLEVKKSFRDTVLIMILPPSLEEVRNRLIKRGTESIEKIDSRMSRIEYELSKQDQYDYAVINDDLIKTVERIEEILLKEKHSNKGE